MVVVVLVVEQTMPSNTQKTDVHGVCETYIYTRRAESNEQRTRRIDNRILTVLKLRFGSNLGGVEAGPKTNKQPKEGMKKKGM